MKKSLLLLSSALFSMSAFAQNPSCQPKVHVWYSLKNDSQSEWFVQLSRLYENNISFVDANCQPIDINQKLSLQANELKKLGMVVNMAKGFNSTYAFMGVRNDPQPNPMLSKGRVSCIFIVAPYGPGQMDRYDIKANNSDCQSTDYGTKLYFK
ncbi:hypothetical protein [Fluviispira multicolorata]|uniref:Uncharacterized protein n=1 Tax=Fluviispira multicolorata TaxID=2654512 RepID=A0A833JHY1_9BACT|nr:hypothetical protein [Fluviispira multicolorata]KAB8033763.1 hypothetical protein GCL57_03385 [Fluviispira multicolorata]